MKLKILKIEVEKSRLLITSKTNDFTLMKNQTTALDATFHNPFRDDTGDHIAILPVLVSDEDMEVDDEVIFRNQRYTVDMMMMDGWSKISDNMGIKDVHVTDMDKLITQDTEELYEQLASGKLEFDRWYEFDYIEPIYEQLSTQKAMIQEGKLSRPLRVVEGDSLGVLHEGESNADEQPNFNGYSKEEMKRVADAVKSFGATDDEAAKIAETMRVKTPYEKSIENDTPEEVQARLYGYSKRGYPSVDLIGDSGAGTPKAPTDEEIANYLKGIVKYFHFQGDDFFAFRTKKGNWNFGYKNDHPDQHGNGETMSITGEMAKWLREEGQKDKVLKQDELLNSVFSLANKISLAGYGEEAVEMNHLFQRLRDQMLNDKEL